jgi:hypothetical protein
MAKWRVSRGSNVKEKKISDGVYKFSSEVRTIEMLAGNFNNIRSGYLPDNGYRVSEQMSS